MTTDGISTEDWGVVQDYAARLANCATRDEGTAADGARNTLLSFLAHLETKYGKLPSILGTRADYERDWTERRVLFEEAYLLAEQLRDEFNMALISSSLAELFICEAGDPHQGQIWLEKLAGTLENSWDDDYYKAYQSLSAQLKQ